MLGWNGQLSKRGATNQTTLLHNAMDPKNTYGAKISYLDKPLKLLKLALVSGTLEQNQGRPSAVPYSITTYTICK